MAAHRRADGDGDALGRVEAVEQRRHFVECPFDRLAQRHQAQEAAGVGFRLWPSAAMDPRWPKRCVGSRGCTTIR